MKGISYLKKFVLDPRMRFYYFSRLGLLNGMSDADYLRRQFRLWMGTELDLEDPKGYNEKLQWLKVYDHRPEYSIMVDKYAVKQWVADRIGEQYLIPTLGVWDHFDQIDFDALPRQFVLKCTHDSGSIFFVRDKSAMDKKEMKRKLESCLRQKWYRSYREWAYKDVKPRIIAEAYMTDESGTELKDYKVFNFDGVPRLIQVDYDRFTDHKRNLYTTDWQYLPVRIIYPTDPSHPIARPECLEEMLDLAHRLSEGYPHLRTDFYCIRDRVYFGELTFYHESGMAQFDPPSFNLEMGSWLKLPDRREREKETQEGTV